jgi:hypothetical protein
MAPNSKLDELYDVIAEPSVVSRRQGLVSIPPWATGPVDGAGSSRQDIMCVLILHHSPNG